MAKYEFTEQDMQVIEYIKQRLAINFNEGQTKLLIPTAKPLLSFAVPGSGKTNTMTGLVALLELVSQIAGSRIWVVTFTRKSTSEFKKRHEKFMKKIDPTLKSMVNIKTIHAACNHYVAALQHSMGLEDYTIMSESETENLLKEVVNSIRKGSSNQSVDTRTLLGTIGWLDNRLFFDRHQVVSTSQFRSLKMKYEEYKLIYDNYKYLMKSLKKLSQDEVMLQFYNYLKSNEVVRQQIQKEIEYICVDEFQDTTPLQYEIIKSLKSEKCGMAVVGDGDQSIYKWRGATNIIFNFMSDFPDHEKAKMNVNYRCPDIVIQCSNALIRNNVLREEIEAVGTGKQGDIEIIPCTGNHQATLEIGSRIIKQYLDSNRDNNVLSDKLILYRNHAQVMMLIYLLATNEVPVNTSGAMLPHKDKIVKDVLGIIEMLKNPRDSQLAHEYMRLVTSQITKKQKQSCPFFNSDASTHFAKVPVQVKDMKVYTHELQKLLQISQMVQQDRPAVEIFKEIVPIYLNNYYMKYRIYEFMNKTVDDVDAIIDFLYTALDPNYTVGQFKLVMNKCERFLKDQKESFIGLDVYSMHGAKGLEAEEVYLLDINGKSSPNQTVVSSLMESRSYAELEDYISEERSLFYVAITRAKKKLVVTYNKNNPSPFNLESGLNADMKVYESVISLEKLGVSPFQIKEARDKLMGIRTPNTLYPSDGMFTQEGFEQAPLQPNPIQHAQPKMPFNGGLNVPAPPVPPQPNNGPIAPPPPPSKPAFNENANALAGAMSGSHNRAEQEQLMKEHLNSSFSQLKDSATKMSSRPDGEVNPVFK